MTARLLEEQNFVILCYAPPPHPRTLAVLAIFKWFRVYSLTLNPKSQTFAILAIFKRIFILPALARAPVQPHNFFYRLPRFSLPGQAAAPAHIVWSDEIFFMIISPSLGKQRRLRASCGVMRFSSCAKRSCGRTSSRTFQQVFFVCILICLFASAFATRHTHTHRSQVYWYSLFSFVEYFHFFFQFHLAYALRVYVDTFSNDSVTVQSIFMFIIVLER